MKLSRWAKLKGIHYSTALRWVKDNKMPVPFERTKTGTILVSEPAVASLASSRVALYARVSGSGQKADLDAQLGVTPTNVQ